MLCHETIRLTAAIQILSLLLAGLYGVSACAYDRDSEDQIYSTFYAYLGFQQSGRSIADCNWEARRKLDTDFSNARNSSSEKQKTAALIEIAKYLKQCSAPHSGSLMYGLNLGLILFPDMPFDNAVAMTVETFRQNGLDIEESDLAWVRPIPQTEDLCPFKTLLNEKSFAGPFRLTDQRRNNCYAHAGVKAADYFQMKNGLPLTSIASTSVEVWSCPGLVDTFPLSR